MGHRGIFTEEVIYSWLDTGKISTSLNKTDCRDRILTALDQTIRFNGMMSIKWSILKHSWMVGVLAEDYAITDMAGDNIQLTAHLMGMLHDAGEAIVGDMVWPLKSGRFKSVYDENYLPLENAFRNWTGEYVFDIDGFESKFNEVKKYVDKADALMGEIEMFGASIIADYGFAAYARSFFSETPVINKDKFVSEIEFLKNQLKNTDGYTE